MLNYVLRRILFLIPTLLLVSVLSFSIIHFAPGDPAELLMTGPDGIADPVAVKEFSEKMGFDRPFHVQYGIWLKQVISGDLGYSYMTGQPVAEAITHKFAATFKLAVLSMFFALLIAVPGGIIAALGRDTWKDDISRFISLIGVSVPNFWQSYIMILVFALILDMFPVGGYGESGELKFMILPAITLGTASAAVLMRLVRSSLLDVLDQDYIRAARARGIPEHIIIGKYGLKNAFIPVITMLGLSFGYLLNGSVVVETVFAWPGIGNLMVNSIYDRDYPMIQGTLLFVATIFVVVNLLVDISYAYLDPRWRYDENNS
ncbi:binding-protein-dependent transport systems inner membrane component [Methanosalsum zhilinae DSM 4017]|uniref:Binding-protein-dependent transport systems inner membrane component n=1 Tax=Methanosalsum zhilinae (strain DSM 4017 / NBRC 107636 / OCM 62 / WeN5) TaxID=679901 RepID=F7XNJ2_METZD|nr:nickel ABC transporter permease [Methanosalsum zhilinae]AEH60089.1 binding-protein-dependent transport systems inner membrane component [Methanosalsum zhilinae DSM 4017]